MICGGERKAGRCAAPVGGGYGFPGIRRDHEESSCCGRTWNLRLYPAKDAYYNAVMNWMERNHNWKTEREWIVKTPGVVFALGAAVKAFTDPGDAILIQNPVYYPFTNIIRDNDRRVVDNTLIYEKRLGRVEITDTGLILKILSGSLSRNI